MDGSNSAELLIAELRAHNESLRQEVDAWREQSRRKDSILMAMAQRIPGARTRQRLLLRAARTARNGLGGSGQEQGPSEQQ